MSSNTDYSKLCIYGCGIHIYWNKSKKAFYEVDTGNRHICPNSKPTTKQTRPTYYKKSLIQSQTEQQKAKMFNSIQILQGRIEEVTKQYEKLSDIIAEIGGKLHGSQSHFTTRFINDKHESSDETTTIPVGKNITTGGIITKNTDKDSVKDIQNIFQIIVFYEVPEGRRELVRQRFHLFQMTNQSDSNTN
ncbi:MAG: hypothetical protein ACE5SW_06720 [Nitrososphaeraceae archaeon]